MSCQIQTFYEWDTPHSLTLSCQNGWICWHHMDYEAVNFLQDSYSFLQQLKFDKRLQKQLNHNHQNIWRTIQTQLTWQLHSSIYVVNSSCYISWILYMDIKNKNKKQNNLKYSVSLWVRTVKIPSLTYKCSPYSLRNSTEFPESPIGLLFGRGAIDFIKKTRGAHYRMMTASWEVNKKSIWNYITASTGWCKASYHTPLPTPIWKTKEGFFLQEYHVVVKHGEGNKRTED